MTKGNGKGNGADKHTWLSQPHNKEFSDMFGKEEADKAMEDDIDHKRRYDEIDRTLHRLRAVNKRLRKKSLLASLRCREIAASNEDV